MLARPLQALQAELRNLGEDGTEVSFSQEEARILDLKNAYDEYERPLETLKAELQKLTEDGTEVSFSKEEALLLDLKNVYDELDEEGEVEND